MTVLDSTARVHFVRGLWVVDTSALPLLMAGNSPDTVYAFPEEIPYDFISQQD
jgi:choline dehydrogenase-like flavoprotein